ncbi:hypothetical protein C8T65DRAFT_662492 [Cerioporus squamosus]|nr:hypothetical protein C8T65DRAFT_662492 [Cerioporus squamosus]
MRACGIAGPVGTLVYVSLFTSPIHAHPTGMASPSRATDALHGRQDVPATSANINWWPYPSYSVWGQTTYATGTTPGAAPTSFASFTSAAADAVSTVPFSYSDDSITTATSLLGPLSSSSTTSASLSASLVRIAAMPPASSESSIARARARMVQNGSSDFNIVYLAPLFGVLGAIAGGLLTWLLYRCLPVRREEEAQLVSGPAYHPPTLFRQGRPAELVPSEVDARPSTSSTRGLVAERPAGRPKTGSWLGRAFSSRSKASTAPSNARASDVTGSGEDDPFLDDSTPTRPPSAASRHGTRTSESSRSRQVTSSDVYGARSDADEITPYESLRHKSIRRGILERLRSSTLRRSKATYKLTQTDDSEATPVQHRRGYRRADTDTSGASSSDQDGDEAPSRPRTPSRNSSQRVTSPSGFRIVVEDPVSGALLEEDEVYSPQASPTPRPSIKRRNLDKFTPAPIRRSTDEKRNSPFASPSKAGIASPPPAQVVQGTNRVDSSILPMSPPMVTSPPLESQLFFGASSASLVLLRSAPAVSVKTVVTTMEKGKKDEGKQPNKLRTQREPPLLPFPSTASTSPYRGRLKKSATRNPQPQTQAQATTERHDSAASSSSSDSAYSQATTATNGKAGRGTAAERYLARKTALSKVDEILSRSWCERQLAGEGLPGTSNKFSAVLPAVSGEEECLDGKGENGGTEEAEVFLSMGIEQRLAAFRR